MSPRRSRQRLLLLAAVIVGAAGIAGAAKAGDLLQSLELDSVDARFDIRGERSARKDIVIVALDGRTISKLGLRPPLPRSYHARLLDRLRAADARVIAYDFQFIGRTRPREDRLLLEAIRRARPVLLATHDVRGPALRVPAGVADPSRLGALLGTVGLLNDPDGKIRRAPYRGVRDKAFAVRTAELALARPVDPDSFPAWIDYRGPPGTFTTYSFARVLAGQVPMSAFKGKVVIVGATDPIEKDVFSTPASDSLMSGAEIHANAVATILDGFPLTAAPGAINILLLVLAAAAVPASATRLSGLRVLAFAGVVLVVFVVGAQLSFDAGTIVDVAYPLLALTLGTSATLAVDYFSTTRERRQLRRAFSRFVPEHVIDDVMRRTDEDLRLGGVTLEATVLFCDLRGFTSFAESQSASTVIDVLNQYLTEMSDAILEHGGTVVAYMGDGIMAVFGAPIEQADNPDRALAAAREISGARLDRFNRWLLEGGRGEGFRIGVGLATGPIQSGNVGSEKRLEYAAVGDTTNVAARLEAQTKETPYQLLLAESTRIRLRSEPEDLTYAGEYVLRGRRSATKAWSVTSSAVGTEGDRAAGRATSGGG